MVRKNADAVRLGRRGGKARLKKMTAEERKAIASKAGTSAWAGISAAERSRIMRERRKGARTRKATERKRSNRQ